MNGFKGIAENILKELIMLARDANISREKSARNLHCYFLTKKDIVAELSFLIAYFYWDYEKNYSLYDYFIDCI